MQVLRPHRDPTPLRGLCISGGGIRSATFGLGALQGLAEKGLLQQFDYLSTVSGGGHIGSWLSIWAARLGSVDDVAPRLRPDARSSTAGKDEPDPIQHLRDYNSYLSPTRGGFSADLWTLLATVVRNIILNWLVLIPLLLLVMMLPRLCLSILAAPERVYGALIFAGAQPDYAVTALYAVSRSLLVRLVLPLSSLGLFATALFSTLRYLPGVGGRNHTRLDYNVGILAPLFGAVLTFLLFDSLPYLGSGYKDYTHLSSVILWTTVPCGAAWVLFLVFDQRPLRDRLRLVFGRLSIAIAAMAAGTGAATWATTNFLLWTVHANTVPSWAEYVTIGPPAVLLGFGLGTGLTSSFLKDEDREWMSRTFAVVLLACALWTGLCVVVLILPKWTLAWRGWGSSAVAAGAAVSAWLSNMGGLPVSSATPSPGTRNVAMVLASKLAPVAFIALLGIALSMGTNMLLAEMHSVTGMTLAGNHGEPIAWRDHYAMLNRSSFALLACLSVVFLAASSVMSRYVNVNTFSLHGMYRDRLVRAYLGASNRNRRPNAFTGFDRNDDMPIAALAGTRPFHVVNVTLNLGKTSRLAWQQRRAASFTISPLHCGSADLGYRDSAGYAGGITLGAAVAISGAAASPNTGYHSSPLVSFIMTLFNARLGSWLGSPGPAGARTWMEPAPRSAIRSLVKEALGLTSDRSDYVYLSDGGHFENLAVYEMVRRRCRMLVVLDAGCDQALACNDLGNAWRKIRIDLGIPIEFDEAQMRLLLEGKRRWAVANIRYSAVDTGAENGCLVYVKPVLTGTEPPDVRSYAAAHPSFPHQSSANQSFDEAQTESYRQLGLLTIREMCEGWSIGSLGDFCSHLKHEPVGAAAVPK